MRDCWLSKELTFAWNGFTQIDSLVRESRPNVVPPPGKWPRHIQTAGGEKRLACGELQRTSTIGLAGDNVSAL